MKVGCNDATVQALRRLWRIMPPASKSRRLAMRAVHQLRRQRREAKLREFWAYEQGRWNGETKGCVMIQRPRLLP
jgi:hypothetical protein